VRGDAPPDGWPAGFAALREDRRALLVLASLRGLEAARLLALAASLGSASACLAAVRAGRAGSGADRHHARTIDPDDVAARVRACGARFVPVGTPGYPPQLEHLRDPPAALFVRGRELADPSTTVGVVGSRRCTDTGRELARELGRGLAEAGACVVSGAARGIDAAAHEGALDAEGHTVAVSACGIDEVYPPGSRALVSRIARTGTIVSE
jgi:DNA processing protein